MDSGFIFMGGFGAIEWKRVLPGVLEPDKFSGPVAVSAA
jgi:hypothetical protein